MIFQYGVSLNLGRYEDGSVASIVLFTETIEKKPPAIMDVAKLVRGMLQEVAKEEGHLPVSFVKQLFKTTWGDSGNIHKILGEYGFSFNPFNSPLKGWYILERIDDWVSDNYQYDILVFFTFTRIG